MRPEPALDLDAYLARVGYSGEPRPAAPGLESLHLAHATHVPFENLDILLGKPIRLDLDSLQAKLVRGGRGGYCFEQNTLFAAALARVGFRVAPLAARVRQGPPGPRPRTHMVLRVEADGGPWLADVGFGGDGPLLPVRLAPGEVSRQFHWTYRVAREADGAWVLQQRQAGAWQDLYAFTEEPQLPADFEVANYYVSTHPESRFVRTLTAQRPSPEARHVLRGREYTVSRGDEAVTRAVAEEELLGVLAEHFGLAFPAGTRFRTPAG
jgi:N-hydroxyarylamine O-acetyltransferase